MEKQADAARTAETKKQVEYYLSDKNLAQDKFFNEKIAAAGAEGWIDLSFILACNKIKSLKVSAADIQAAVADSTQVEVDAAGKRIRRKGTPALPALSSKKREQKAAEKEESKQEEEPLPQLDERGNPVLGNADFENPVIVHFKTEGADASFKVSWKDVEAAVRKACPRLKITYSRADQFEGDLAVSSHRINNAELDQLVAGPLTAQGHQFTFSKTTGEELKSFWQKQGGHYQFCI